MSKPRQTALPAPTSAPPAMTVACAALPDGKGVRIGGEAMGIAISLIIPTGQCETFLQHFSLEHRRALALASVGSETSTASKGRA